MKSAGRVIVKKCFAKILQPKIQGSHNSLDEERTIAENVSEVIDKSLFLKALDEDENVSDRLVQIYLLTHHS